MKRIMIILCCLMLTGCAAGRTMNVTADVKDGKYGVAKMGKGQALYTSSTWVSLFCKGVRSGK